MDYTNFDVFGFTQKIADEFVLFLSIAVNEPEVQFTDFLENDLTRKNLYMA
jgi:hypothetical protein